MVSDGETFTEYQAIVGALNYIACRTRPDIAYAVSYAAQYLTRSNQTHFKYAKDIVRYLKMTKDLAIGYKKNNELKVECYVDANFNGEGGKSYTGYVVMINGGPVAWKSQKQKLWVFSVNIWAQSTALIWKGRFVSNLLDRS